MTSNLMVTATSNVEVKEVYTIIFKEVELGWGWGYSAVQGSGSPNFAPSLVRPWVNFGTKTGRNV